METPAQTAVREAIGFNAGLNRLLKMFGLRSIQSNLEAEDAAFNRCVNGKHKKQKAGPSDEMQIYSAGNVTINHPAQSEPSGSQSAPAAPEKKAGAGWLPKLLLAASLLGGGSGVGYIIHDLIKQQPSADTDTSIDINLPE